jgi:hypothetical protein
MSSDTLAVNGAPTAALSNAAEDVPATVLALNEVTPELEDEFNRWYEEDAIPARLSIPGYLSAQRYHSVVDGHSYAAFYRCRSVAALFSPEYKRYMSDLNAWRMSVRRGFRSLQWSVCHETWSTGNGVGSGAVIVQCSPVTGREAHARAFLRDELAPRIRRQGGIVRMALWEADPQVTALVDVSSRENLEHYTNWVICIESSDLMKIAPGLQAELLSVDSTETGLVVGSIMRYALLSAHFKHFK